MRGRSWRYDAPTRFCGAMRSVMPGHLTHAVPNRTNIEQVSESTAGSRGEHWHAAHDRDSRRVAPRRRGPLPGWTTPDPLSETIKVMTALLRCRGSTAEMALQFDAVVDTCLDWRETIWTGDMIPVVLGAGDHRRLATSQWGLPGDAFVKDIDAKRRGTLYSRDLVTSASRLRDPARLRRCLIVIESFAYPEGPAGEKTRTWFGLWDSALAAWAGFCTPDGANCAGLLTMADDGFLPRGDTMPLLLPKADRARWLAGAGQLSLGPPYSADAYYRENLGERWSTGRLDDEDAAKLSGPRR